MWPRHHDDVPAGVVDVGSNTVRLLVSRHGEPVYGERRMLGLGEAVELHGAIPAQKLDEVTTTVAGYVERAREHGAGEVEVLVTSPGRQAANGDELIARLEAAAGVPVRLLSAVDEARLGYAGALDGTHFPFGRSIAVVDVGGGSAQIAVGTKHSGPTWIRSIDIGSMRLTSRCLEGDPPGLDAIAGARAEVERFLVDVDPPEPRVALAVGGSARALRRVAGSRLGSEELTAAIALLATTPSAEIAARYGVAPGRARTLPAGAVILAAIGELLDVRFRVGRGGVREGAVLELEHRRAAA